MVIPSQANNFKTWNYWACVETRWSALGSRQVEGIVQSVKNMNLQDTAVDRIYWHEIRPLRGILQATVAMNVGEFGEAFFLSKENGNPEPSLLN